MRLAIRFFAVLDMISIALLSKQFLGIMTHLNQIPKDTLSQTKVILMLPLFVSLFISVFGLMLLKKYGFITYYVQFPFRLIIWIFSIGFITYLPELLNLNETWFDILFKICFIGEFFRLYYTIKIHKAFFNLQ